MIALGLGSELFCVGLLAGTIDAVAGGGGLITLPFLLGMGLPPQMVLGTNKLQSLVGTGSACWHFIRSRLVSWQSVRFGLCMSALGAVGGVGMAHLISPQFLKKMIPVILFFILIYIILKPNPASRHAFNEDPVARVSPTIFYSTVGVILGWYDGFIGSGVGSMWVALLMLGLGMTVLQATAYTKIFNFNTNVVSAILFASLGAIHYPIALCMALGQGIGGRLGALLATRRGVNLIKPLLILMTSLNLLSLLYVQYGKILGNLIVK